MSQSDDEPIIVRTPPARDRTFDPARHTRVPQAAVDAVTEGKLSYAAFGILAWLAAWSAPQPPTVADVYAGSSNDKPATVDQALAELQAAGYITPDLRVRLPPGVQ